MTRPTIQETFAQLKQKNEKALVVFVTAGDPHLRELPAILSALQEGGADIIEVGIPFSDPIADGNTIQAASQRALEAGATPRGVLETLRSSELHVPVILMGYYNPILRYGLSAFAAAASAAGASGAIVCDLTPEEAGEWNQAARDHAIDTIYLTAPTSTDERLDAVAQNSSGFVYAVSRTGVTGALDRVPEEAFELVRRLKKRTTEPVCIGFGISKPEHVRQVVEVADGAIVGSSIVDLIHRTWNGGEGKSKLVEAVKALKEATKPGS